MTAFSPSNLPSNITTLEALHIWTSQVLSNLYPGLTVLEFPGVTERVIQSSPVFLTASEPARWNAITRTSLPLNANWQRGSKLWLNAVEIGTLAIPSEFQV